MGFFTPKKKTLTDFIDLEWIDSDKCPCGLPLYKRNAFFQTFESKKQEGDGVDENTSNIIPYDVPPQVKSFIQTLTDYSVIRLRNVITFDRGILAWTKGCNHDQQDNSVISYMIVKDRRPVLFVKYSNYVKWTEYFPWEEIQIDMYKFEGNLPDDVGTVENIDVTRDAHFLDVSEIRANDWYKLYKEYDKPEVLVLSLMGGMGLHKAKAQLKKLLPVPPITTPVHPIQSLW